MPSKLNEELPFNQIRRCEKDVDWTTRGLILRTEDTAHPPCSVETKRTLSFFFNSY